MSITPHTWQLRSLVACSLVAVVLTTACDQGKHSAGPTQAVVESLSAQSTPPLPELPPRFVAQELLQLRDTVDPGWAERGDIFAPFPLRDGEAGGADAGLSDRELFTAHLRRLAGDDSATMPPSPPPTPHTVSTQTEQAQIEALRRAAYQLDLAAYLLEQQDLTARADELRGLAGPLRDDARRLQQSRSAAVKEQSGATSTR